MTIKNPYPEWVCTDCGLKASGGYSHSISTYHHGICGVCKKEKPVTQPRDFGTPQFKRIRKGAKNVSKKRKPQPDQHAG